MPEAESCFRKQSGSRLGQGMSCYEVSTPTGGAAGAAASACQGHKDLAVPFKRQHTVTSHQIL